MRNLRGNDALTHRADHHPVENAARHVVRVSFERHGAQTNAFSEAWIGALKRECLAHFLCFSLGVR
jgi:hypothetical protein